MTPEPSVLQLKFAEMWDSIPYCREFYLRPETPVEIAGGKTVFADFRVYPRRLADIGEYGDEAYKRVDELLEHIGFKLLIECDGHDFHERTKEQVIARNQRDRELNTLGFLVFHVSGAEFNRNPRTTAIVIADECMDIWSRSTKKERLLFVLRGRIQKLERELNAVLDHGGSYWRRPRPLGYASQILKRLPQPQSEVDQ